MTSSVRIAGVLLVFSYLIVPAALAGLFAASLRARLWLAWAAGAAVTAAGLHASWTWDLPTGPAIVAAFGAAMAAAAAWLGMKRLTVRGLGLGLAAASLAAGLLFLAFPRSDQPWRDALDAAVPALELAFLTEGERAVHADTSRAVREAGAELSRLRALEQDVRWGTRPMEPEKQERLRQYLAGRAEILAGDRLVLQDLRAQARERQRLALGLPLLLSGAVGLLLLWRVRRPAGAPR